MSPLILSDHLVPRFKYWRDERVQTGIRYGQELFGCHQAFPKQQRQQAYALAFALSERAISVIITVSATEYIVWLSLRARGLAPSGSAYFDGVVPQIQA